MSSYQSNIDLTHYAEQIVMYQEIYSEWESVRDAQQADYENRHTQWQYLIDNPVVLDPPEPPPLEPSPPEIAPEPSPPVQPRIFTSRVVEQSETISVPGGEILVMPGRVVLQSDGEVFAISSDELAYAYTELIP